MCMHPGAKLGALSALRRRVSRRRSQYGSIVDVDVLLPSLVVYLPGDASITCILMCMHPGAKLGALSALRRRVSRRRFS